MVCCADHCDPVTSPLLSSRASGQWSHKHHHQGLRAANVTVKSCLALLPDAGWWEANLWAGYDQVITQLSDFSVTFSQSPAERASQISQQPRPCLSLSLEFRWPGQIPIWQRVPHCKLASDIYTRHRVTPGSGADAPGIISGSEIRKSFIQTSVLSPNSGRVLNF